ncbi:thiol peroxidase [Streptococcus ferus]|uniref:Thiol peroxidase n=1 Tax=Streptococcus ferus TaxID=1345 RepID=A0A2X3XZB1_9STRE|nr:thiol peroxidase [Streptococcus ferus]SQF40491.1 lipid hydroperoxide peroxidase [Streptococcus ferus]
MATFKGSPITLEGNRLAVGDLAPDFLLTAPDLSKKRLTDFEGPKIISVVPSIDTGVCDAQTRRFNEALADSGVAVITVSVDLPFAQKRWCAAAGLDHVSILSDYFDHSFAEAYGVWIKELHLLARAVFVLDETNQISYVEYLDEMSQHPDYDAALEAVK